MRLLLDQNLSPKLAARLRPRFGCVDQVRELGLEDASDLAIWEFARAKNYAIVTNDEDFRDLAALYGTPPLIILLRFGNLSTSHLTDKLNHRFKLINDYCSDKRTNKILVLMAS